MRSIVLGGAGFIGSHLVDRLLARGDEVVAVDSLLTGRRENAVHNSGNSRYQFLQHDICRPIPLSGPADAVFNLASPASPIDYSKLPLETLEVGSNGTRHALELARAMGATLVHASTSEVYGDPLEHPQREAYFGNVNPIGPRACYDEAKRFAETLVTTYARVHPLPIRIARIFNTYGPRMHENDGRVVSNFAVQALRDAPITVYGEGQQTRSFCYVSDLVEGFVRLMASPHGVDPVNLGNPRETTVLELAEMTKRLAKSKSEIIKAPLPKDDPTRRKPDIGRAQKLLDNWGPRVSLEEGLAATIEDFRRRLGMA